MPQNSEAVVSVAIQIVVVLLLLVAFAVAAHYVRRRLARSERFGKNGLGWDLQGLEELRDQGQLSEDEFRTLRNQLLGIAGQGVDKKK